MRVTPNTYIVGAVVTLSASFKDLAGDLTDPDAVTFKILEPDDAATVTEYTFGVDVELVKDDVGLYHVDWTTRYAGEHCYRFQGAGGINAVAEKHFDVDAGCFV
jgi:hypothetical protein